MSLAYTCDYCGERIDDDEENYATISARGTAEDDGESCGWRSVSGWIGHYHATLAQPCYDRVRDAIDLVREWAPAVAALPTTSEPTPPALTPHVEAPAASERVPAESELIACPRGRGREVLERGSVWARQRERRAAIAAGPGGVDALGLPHGVRQPLVDAVVLTIEDVQRRVRDGSIGDVPNVGPSRLEILREALARWERERSGKAVQS
jgi:hypothetical protein